MDPDLVVTDETSDTGGAVVFFSKTTGEEIERVELPKFHGEREPGGRNKDRICHHPVFNHTGDRVLCNHLPDDYSTLIEISPPKTNSRVNTQSHIQTLSS